MGLYGVNFQKVNIKASLSPLCECVVAVNRYEVLIVQLFTRDREIPRAGIINRLEEEETKAKWPGAAHTNSQAGFD